MHSPGLDRIPIDEHVERVLIAAACRVDSEGKDRPVKSIRNSRNEKTIRPSGFRTRFASSR